MQAQQRGRFEDNRGTDQSARADEGRTQTGDHTIRRTEIGRPFSKTIEDQQLVLDEHGFGPAERMKSSKHAADVGTTILERIAF
jgi:hypothetical protein